MTREPWTVDFWFDPSCPLSWVTARWLRGVARERPVTVRWRVMSLSVLNEGRDEDPEGDTEGYLWIPARVCAAVQSGHGHEALGRFHEALWTGEDAAESGWIGDLADALRRAGLPGDLAGAGLSGEHDPFLRASHHDAVRRVPGEVGTPILALAGADGAPRAVFGPVVTEPPGRKESLRLWEAVVLLTGVPGFREIKA
ncbi:mycothiol-dependent nitroreductase Rv2466c family protein [Nocardiopsis sp. M1B1]|uniref:mycothiol-dependent nitroreductase Rv2466c family protein n=1 Tax=Nocardiopsis sp. M1B1 TaxID=3450454 RepID=UPI004039592A